MSDVDLMPWVCDDLSCLGLDNGPCRVGNTGSRQITEVKQRWARLVLGWVTVWVQAGCC